MVDPTPPNQATVRCQPILSPRTPQRRFQMMLEKKIRLRSCSHCVKGRPIVLTKKVGMKTRKPSSAAVLIVRTAAPAPIRGCFHRMVIARPSVVTGLSPAAASGFIPVRSRTSSSAISPPTATNTTEAQKVLYWPRSGIRKLANNEPKVGNPPVKANQNQPAAELKRLGGVAAAIQTRKPKANRG